MHTRRTPAPLQGNLVYAPWPTINRYVWNSKWFTAIMQWSQQQFTTLETRMRKKKIVKYNKVYWWSQLQGRGLGGLCVCSYHTTLCVTLNPLFTIHTTFINIRFCQMWLFFLQNMEEYETQQSYIYVCDDHTTKTAFVINMIKPISTHKICSN